MDGTRTIINICMLFCCYQNTILWTKQRIQRQEKQGKTMPLLEKVIVQTQSLVGKIEIF